MDGGHIGLALAAGMLATVNPCGLPMLPVYLSFFVSGDDDEGTTRRGDLAAVVRALGVAATVSVGFLVVFGAAGMLVSWVTSDVYRVAPWLTMVVGLLLIGLGGLLLAGKHLLVALPKLDKGGRTRGLGSMFVFGVSYAVASLGCELPVFLAQVSNTFGENPLDGLLLAVVFVGGMALVLMALSVSLALARTELASALRRGMRVIDRVAGGFLVLAGAYLTYYGRVEIAKPDHPGAAVDKVTGWSSSIGSFMQQLSAYRLAGLLVVVVGVALGVAWYRADRRGPTAPERSGEPVVADAAAQEDNADSSTPRISSP